MTVPSGVLAIFIHQRSPPSSSVTGDTRPTLPGQATFVLTYATVLFTLKTVTAGQFKRWLRKHGCTFEPGRGGHLRVRLGRKFSTLPMHGSGKELGTGLVQQIKRDLGLK